MAERNMVNLTITMSKEERKALKQIALDMLKTQHHSHLSLILMYMELTTHGQTVVHRYMIMRQLRWESLMINQLLIQLQSLVMSIMMVSSCVCISGLKERTNSVLTTPIRMILQPIM